MATALAALGWASGARAQVAPAAPEPLAVGDWRLAPVLEARVRGEYRKDLDGADRGILTERARLGVDASRGAVEARVVLQDARVWDLGTGGDFLTGPLPIASTGVYEAWGEAHTSGAHPSLLRIGRQEVTWGEGRLLGVSDWSPTGRTLDAVRGRLVTGDWAFELLAAVLETPLALTTAGSTLPLGATQAYGQLFGARAQWDLDPLFGVELYGLARFAQTNPLPESLDQTVEGSTYTGALRLAGDARGWTWAVEGAYQGGKADHVVLPPQGGTFNGLNPASFSESRSAWAAAGHVGYRFEHLALTPSVRLGGSTASGDDGSSSRFKTFDPILPDAHTWYGAMDLLTWSNEIEANARVSIVPWTDGLATVEYRYLRFAQASGGWTTGYVENITLIPNTGNTSAELGHEVDASIAWAPWTPLDLRAGYSVLALGDGAKASVTAVAPTQGATPPSLSHFAYLQASVRIP